MYMHIVTPQLWRDPLVFCFPFLIPFCFLSTSLYLLGNPPWCDRIPFTFDQVARKLISRFPSPPYSKIPTPWGFPELNMRLTKTTSRIQVPRSRTSGASITGAFPPNMLFSTWRIATKAIAASQIPVQINFTSSSFFLSRIYWNFFNVKLVPLLIKWNRCYQ